MCDDVKLAICPKCGNIIYSIGNDHVVCSKCGEVIFLCKKDKKNKK